MIRVRRAILLASTFAALSALVGLDARSASDPAATVKERQDFMGSFWPTYMKDLAAIAKGSSTDISHVAEKAAGLAVAARKIPSYFPAGTGRDVVPKTRARPEVWSDRAGFEAAVGAFAREAEKLEAVAKEGKLEPIKAQITATAQACFGCHDGPAKSGGKYRYEEN